MDNENKGKIGFRINGDFERLDQGILERFRKTGTCALSDGLNKFNTMHHQIKPIDETLSIAGCAFTVKMRPGDNLMLHKAIAMAKPGDVIVVDTCGCDSNCVMGDLMGTAAMQQRLGGVVIDGGIRDILELKQSKAPIFAKCITPAVGDKDGPGEINGLVVCGGVAVVPGDVIVGDANGVVVVPKKDWEAVLTGAEAKLEKDRARMAEIMSGVIAKKAIDDTLKNAGVL
jgi:regulator of RNase E activity RraA